jgi:hypothetical protein
MAVDHKAIPDAELHPPKGFAGAANNTVLTRTSGTPTWKTLTAENLASNSVTTAKIANGNVTAAKIADGDVTNAKLTDDDVRSGKLRIRTQNYPFSTTGSSTTVDISNLPGTLLYVEVDNITANNIWIRNIGGVREVRILFASTGQSGTLYAHHIAN